MIFCDNQRYMREKEIVNARRVRIFTQISKKYRSMKLIIVSIFFICLVAHQNIAQTSTQFRGNNRDGVFRENDLLSEWPAGGPALLWENNSIGNGYGSAAVTKDAIYINGEIDSTGYLFALDKQGKILWKADYGKEWVKTFPGSRSTPTIVDDLIYVTSGLGNVTCFIRESGEKKWSVNMARDLNGRFTYHGHAESPLVYDDKVIIVAGGKDTNVVALNRFNGQIEWICKGMGEIPGYNSPILVQSGKKLIVAFTAYHLLGIDAYTGQLVWSHEQVNVPPAERQPGMGDTHSNSVYYENGFIYYVAGDGNCAVKLKLSLDGKTIEQVWRNPAIDDYMGGFIKIGDNIYTGSDSKRNLLCFSATTGLVSDSLKIGCGAILLADNLLYYYNQRGEMTLVKPGEKLEKISSFKVTAGTKEHFSIPVIAGGILYIRHGKSLLAYDIRKKQQ
jgi:outer membrane protein assembly factor BamB